MASTVPGGSRSVSFRLPEWVIDYLQARSRAHGTTKTQVVVDALACLRDQELSALMEEGYRDRAEESLEFAERSRTSATEATPEW